MGISAIGGKQLRELHRAKAKRARTKGSGRRKGTTNYTTRLSREAIVEALCAYGRDGKGKDGMVGFCLAAIHDNIKNGITMLGMITAKQVEATITRTDVVYRTLQELDADLASHGLPTSQEVFRLDYKGSAALDAEELEIIDRATE